MVFNFQPTIEFLVNSTLGDEAGDLFRWRRGEVEQPAMMVRFIFQTGVSRPDLLVSPHVLLAAETLAAGVTEVEVGHVASLVDGEVVRL